MGMRPDLRVARRSGGGCRSGMADSSDNPRLAALRGLEESLRWHRESQPMRTPAKSPTTPSAKPAATTPQSRPAPTAAKSVTPTETADDDHDDLFLDTPPTPVVLRGRRFALPAFVRGRAMRRVAITLAALVT